MLSQAPVPDWSMRDVQDFAVLDVTGRISHRKSSQVAVCDQTPASQPQSVQTVWWCWSCTDTVCGCSFSIGRYLVLSFAPYLVFILLAFSKLASLQHLCICKCDNVKWLFMALRPHCVSCEGCRDTAYLFIPEVCLLTYHPPPPPSPQQSKDTQPPPPPPCHMQHWLSIILHWSRGDNL